MQSPPELDDASRRVLGGEKVSLSVRTLLGWFGVQRRGYNQVSRIQAALARAGLVTVPAFDDVWIDGWVELQRTGNDPAVTDEPVCLVEPPLTPAALSVNARLEGAQGGVPDDATAPTVLWEDSGEHERPVEPGLGQEAPRGGNLVDREPTLRLLSAANLGSRLVTVHESDLVTRVITIMCARDFSQLPVLRTRGHCLGVVNWRSIGRFVTANGRLPTRVSECIEQVHIYTSDRNLFDVVDDVVRTDCVLVRPPNSTQLCGIVTVSDLSMLFGEQLEPFVLAGEVEAGLRRMMERAGLLAGPAGSAVSTGASEWTLGSMQRELDRPETWERLALTLDKQEFIRCLGEVRRTRNELMHFSPDPFDPRGITQLRDFARFLREILRGLDRTAGPEAAPI